MTDATILIRTHRHAALLPFAVRSALCQEEVEIELLVAGDGVEDDTRRALMPFLDDARLRFVDRPKGERHGERRPTERLKLTSLRLEAELERVRGTRWWRARRAVARLRPVRALSSRRREAR